MKRFLMAAALLVCAALQSHAAVTVESSSAIIDQTQSLGGGAYSTYSIPLQYGDTIYVGIETHGGIDDAVQTWLVDLPNFQLLQAGRQFNTWFGTSGRVVQQSTYSFTAPLTNVYYLVLDNRSAFLTRTVHVHVDRSTSAPNAWAAQISALYNKRYEGLKNVFKFDDFNITVRHCGSSNAFSDPNITMCVELLDELSRDNIPAAEEFMFYHEVGHSLLRLWHQPGYDIEDTADEFATAMMMLMGEQDATLQAAQWFEAKDSMGEANATLWQDNPHSLSIQRARNVIKWLNKRDDTLSRWFRVMIPNMTDTWLQKIAAAALNRPPTNADEASVAEAIRAELDRRQVASTN